jgi:hypothetical protein
MSSMSTGHGSPTRPLADASLPHVVEVAFESAKDLLAEEAGRVLDEMGEESRRLERIGAVTGAAALLVAVGSSILVAGILIAAHAGWMGFVVTAVAMLVGAAALGAWAWSMIPDVTFERTRARIAARATRIVAAARDVPTSSAAENGERA